MIAELGARSRRRALAAAYTALVLATVAVSCGSESSDGNLCQQCGPNNGECMASNVVSGGKRPDFCGDQDPCTVDLACVQEVDSRVKRCYPAQGGAVDAFYRCDGTRPAS